MPILFQPAGLLEHKVYSLLINRTIQTVGLIRDIPHRKDLIERMVEDCQTTIARQQRVFA